MQEIIQQVGTFVVSTAAAVPAAQPDEGLLQHVGDFLVGSIPTALLFIVLVLAYQFLMQRPLTAILKKRHALTEGAVEEAQKAIARAEARTAEYAEKLRQAKTEAYKIREQRVKQWNAERDTALEAARKAAALKVSQARAEVETEAAVARQTIRSSAEELANQVIRTVLPMAAGGSR
jgi:F-type H+-transporting ATPase subunit b